MSVDIPDEAWIAAHNVTDADLDAVVRAAAPLIARAAQVEILRAKSRELQSRSFGESQLVARGMELSALLLADEADRIERGVRSEHRADPRERRLLPGASPL